MIHARNVWKTIKDFIVPSEKNNGLPYALSSIGISAYLVLALILLFAPAYLKLSQLASLMAPVNFSEDRIIDLTNKSRAAIGIQTLGKNPILSAAAKAKLEDMFAKQYFAHVSPEGITPWNFIRNAGYPYRLAGENLALDFTTPEEAHAALMNSPSHKANILNPSYREIGIAVAQGNLNGRPSIIVVEHFGRLFNAPQTAASSTAKTTKTKTSPMATSSPVGAGENQSVKKSPAEVSSTKTEGIKIASTSPAVLGDAEIPSAINFAETGTAAGIWREIIGIPAHQKIKLAAIFLIGTLVLSFAMFAARAERISGLVCARTAFALIILSTVVLSSATGVWNEPRVTPDAANIMILNEYTTD